MTVANDKLRQNIEELKKEVEKELYEHIKDIDIEKYDFTLEIYDISLHNALNFEIFSIEDGVKIPLSEKGEGIKNLVILQMYQRFKNSNHEEKPLFLIIDEPEMHMHPRYQYLLLDILNKILDHKGIHVLMASHSTLILNSCIIDYEDKYETFIVKKDKGESHIQSISINLLRQAYGILGERFTSFFIKKGILLVEGKHDRKVLEKLLKNNRVQIIEINGAGSSSKYVKIIMKLKRHTGSEIKICLILDKDHKGKVNGLRQEYKDDKDYLFLHWSSGTIEDTLKIEVIKKLIEEKIDDLKIKIKTALEEKGILDDKLLTEIEKKVHDFIKSFSGEKEILDELAKNISSLKITNKEYKIDNIIGAVKEGFKEFISENYNSKTQMREQDIKILQQIENFFKK